MPKPAVRFWLPQALVSIALVAAGCAATAEDSPERRNGNEPGAGGFAPSTGGTGGASSIAGSAGVEQSGGTGSGTGGVPSGSGGTSGGTTPVGSGGTSFGTGGSDVVHPPADTALPYTEDFEDGEAQGWIDSIDDEEEPLGTWAIVDDATKVYQLQSPTDDLSWAVGGDYRWTDQHLETKVKIVSGAEDAFIVLAIRFSSFRGYYFVEIRDDRIKLRDRGNGSTTDVGTFDIEPPLADGEWHSFGLSAIGTTLTVYFDGTPVITGTSSRNVAGGIGLAARDAVVAFDDVTVTSE